MIYSLCPKIHDVSKKFDVIVLHGPHTPAPLVICQIVVAGGSGNVTSGWEVHCIMWNVCPVDVCGMRASIVLNEHVKENRQMINL